MVRKLFLTLVFAGVFVANAQAAEPVDIDTNNNQSTVCVTRQTVIDKVNDLEHSDIGTSLINVVNAENKAHTLSISNNQRVIGVTALALISMHALPTPTWLKLTIQSATTLGMIAYIHKDNIMAELRKVVASFKAS